MGAVRNGYRDHLRLAAAGLPPVRRLARRCENAVLCRRTFGSNARREDRAARIARPAAERAGIRQGGFRLLLWDGDSPCGDRPVGERTPGTGCGRRNPHRGALRDTAAHPPWNPARQLVALVPAGLGRRIRARGRRSGRLFAPGTYRALCRRTAPAAWGICWSVHARSP